MKNKIEWLGHASLKISGEKVVYVDPWKIERGETADIVLVTHPHHDHCSPQDIEKIRAENTVTVATPDAADKLNGEVRTIAPGRELEIGGVEIEAVPAYNIGKAFHPRENNWVGYVLGMGGESIYIAGDTDHIPEMEELSVDVAILPVGGTYTMTAEEAARAANAIGAQLTIPVHFGDIVGSRRDANRFAKLCDGEVLIL